MLWLALALSPALLREYLNGGDVIANTAAVLAFMVGVLYLRTRWAPILSAFGLGLALSWRPNLWYWAPLFFVALVRRHGWRAAVYYTALSIAVCAAVTLPFYLPHLHNFAPLLTARNVVLTPHIAGATAETIERQSGMMAGEIARFIAGEPLKYAVNPEAMRARAS